MLLLLANADRDLPVAGGGIAIAVVGLLVYVVRWMVARMDKFVEAQLSHVSALVVSTQTAATAMQTSLGEVVRAVQMSTQATVDHMRSWEAEERTRHAALVENDKAIMATQLDITKRLADIASVLKEMRDESKQAR